MPETSEGSLYMPAEGFLSPDLTASIVRIRREFLASFEVVTTFSNLGMRVLRVLKPATTSNPQLLVALLFGRALTSFQSTIILAERGLSADARTVLRAAAETTIVLSGVAIDTAVADLLMLRHQWHRRKLLTSWLNDPQAVAEMTHEQKTAFTTEVAAIDSTHPTVKNMGDPINVHDLAVRTGLLATYNAIYRPVSGDAAHTSLFALERHVRADAAAAVQGLTFGPDTRDLASTLHAAISAFAPAVKAVALFFGKTEFDDELNRCVEAWKKLPY
jgi:hypothetical protein